MAVLGGLGHVAPAAAESFTVTSRLDPGQGTCNRSECTLREALDAANALAGRDAVRFRIGKGHQAIKPGVPLPVMTGDTQIDGWTQRGFKRAPLIEINGAGAGPGASGLVVSGPAVRIRGLVINRFADAGIDVGGLAASGTALIEGTYVGTDARGKQDRGMGGAGVLVRDYAGVTIGGNDPRERVVISGNGSHGVSLSQADTAFETSTIVGTRIGTNAKGTAAIANEGDGIHWAAPWGATIGGPATGSGDSLTNLISGNGEAGIEMVGNCLPICGTQNVIDGNRIGTNLAGLAAIPNGGEGIRLSATGPTAIGGGVGNLISGNGSHGIRVADAAVYVFGNAIGINSAVDDVIPNHGDGVHLDPGTGGTQVGAPTSNDANVIAGNADDGIYVGSTNTQLRSNLVGFYPGQTGFGNSGDGIELAADTTVGGPGGEQNHIAFNDGAGVAVTSDISLIAANSIYDNGGLGIDLANNGPTANDAFDVDTGPNELQNRPTVASVVSTGFSTEVTVELDSVPGTAQANHPYTIELYSNPSGSCDASGGEGRQFLSSISLGTGTDGHGSASTSLGVLPAGSELAATATDRSDFLPWTSEFSACATVPSS